VSQARRKRNRAEARLLDEQRIELQEGRRERHRDRSVPVVPTTGELIAGLVARWRKRGSRP
jgi:hypothetical protein